MPALAALLQKWGSSATLVDIEIADPASGFRDRGTGPR